MGEYEEKVERVFRGRILKEFLESKGALLYNLFKVIIVQLLAKKKITLFWQKIKQSLYILPYILMFSYYNN
jgi:hypothetical protein